MEEERTRINNISEDHMGVNIQFLNDTTIQWFAGLRIYRYSGNPSNNMDSLQGWDLIINIAQTPPYLLRKRVQFMLQKLNGARGPPPTPYHIPYPNAFSNDPNNPNILEFIREEKIIFNHVIQHTKAQYYSVNGPLHRNNNTVPLGRVVEEYWLTEKGEWVDGKVEYKKR